MRRRAVSSLLACLQKKWPERYQSCLSGVQSFHWSRDLKWSNIKSAPTLGSEGSLGPCIHPLGFEGRRSVCQSILVPRYALKPTSSAGRSTPRVSTQLLQDIEDSYLKPRKLHHDNPQPLLFFLTPALSISSVLPLACPIMQHASDAVGS